MEALLTRVTHIAAQVREGVFPAVPPKDQDPQFRHIFDAVPGMICVLNAKGEVELLNARVLEYFGRSLEELKNWALLDAVHPDDVSGVIEAWRHSVATGEPFDREQRQRRADGVYRWQHSRAEPVRDELGRVAAWYMLITDIDDLRQTADALRRSEQSARSQSSALRRILDALAHESSVDRIVEHMLATITEQLHAHSCSVWSRDTDTGLLHFAFSSGTQGFRTRADVRCTKTFSSERGTELWPGVDLFQAGSPQVVEDIRNMPDFPWRSDLLAQGIVTVLVIPMVIASEVRGILGIRFDQKRSLRPEEIQLAQLLANQAMLAMQLSRISAENRQTAVLAERNRMARDMHDTLAQGFTGIIVQLEAAADATSRGLSAAAADHVARAGGLARDSLKDARRSVQALRPQALEQQDFSAALREMVQKLTARTTLQPRIEVSGTPRTLAVTHEDNLLRISQEVLTNALRHAQATDFSVRLAFTDQELSLELRDNGRGFDLAQRSEGLGLLGIRERTEQIGGTLTITTAVGQGTITRIVLPLAPSLARATP
ncbi:PAS domain-containing protein [Opitutus sp. ER46]|uniref:PAS domain-containing protein n=1 Tax=Opitutus sp. ER46 TaxID=2161864 RepID=UPI0011B1C635|nr:PAS domain-containing protein [Opitutus sp. ER46]